MNTATEPLILELEEAKPASLPATAAANLPALADNSPASFMLRALDRGVTPAEVREMMALQREWEANEARKAYNKAMAGFKAEAVEIIKRKRVYFTSQKGTTDYKHAELSDVMEAVGPALAKHGFAWAYKTEQTKEWLTVTCILTHEQGHSESVTLSGPHDSSGNKNPLQQLHSTATYLERVTLKLACGVAEKGEDDDGNGGGETSAYDAEGTLQDWTDKANAAINLIALNETRKMAGQEFAAAKDVAGWNAFKKVVEAKRAELVAGGAQ